MRVLLGVPAAQGSTRLEALLHARRRHLRNSLPALVLVWAIVALADYTAAAIGFFVALTLIELIVFANLQRRIRNERRRVDA